MRIKRLKLCGFKSFVEPAELRIEPGLTGVVGPNGCGKSNLLEAIRWVMAESSPKSMRGGGMEDVIFAGTANRPPRGFAEVVLLAEDKDREELEVVRRIERGTGSAYRLNGRDVRAKDVALIFADAATGAHSPALVSQGRIASIISAKPDQRRLMLEEAAGIAGLHVRRRDAEQKLRATETNLARIADIMAGLDKQIAVLRRQARAAERYKAVSDQIRLAEARLVFARWRDAAAAADAAKAEAQAAENRVAEAQGAAKASQDAQGRLALSLAQAREELADRRDDASAHGHRMAALSSQLEAAEERLADLDRQRARLDQDRADADRMTRDAADALTRLERELADGKARLAEDEARRPALAAALENAERGARDAELALAQATAAQAGIDAEWRVAEAELAAARTRLDRLDQEVGRHAAQREVLGREGDPDALLASAEARLQRAETAMQADREALATLQTRKTALQSERDDASGAVASARAELTGIEREHTALARDREARTKRASGSHGLPAAIDRVRAAPGYERALAAVLGRDAKALVGAGPAAAAGHFWTGAEPPRPVSDSLAGHVGDYPPELAARLALVHVADQDDGRALAPGHWLVTKSGQLRRWDGFIARGEGAAEAAMLEAENRFAELAETLPARRAALADAEARLGAADAELTQVRTAAVAAERALTAAAEDERQALRARDQAEDARQRLASRLAELDAAATDLAEQRRHAEAEREAAEARRSALPDPQAGRA
ncbi:MAG TPA: AAA family ATPase, partial [Novosphingobium sp.]|nr:AAA family ATPase [Novosphingobium sp.]